MYVGERGWLGEGIALAICSVTVFVLSQPISGGSGVPEIKCYLNGVKVSVCAVGVACEQWAWSVSSVCGGRGQRAVCTVCAVGVASEWLMTGVFHLVCRCLVWLGLVALCQRQLVFCSVYLQVWYM